MQSNNGYGCCPKKKAKFVLNMADLVKKRQNPTSVMFECPAFGTKNALKAANCE